MISRQQNQAIFNEAIPEEKTDNNLDSQIETETSNMNVQQFMQGEKRSQDFNQSL